MLKITLLISLSIMNSSIANQYVKEINQLINTDEFKMDAKRALLIDKYYQLEIRVDHDNISNHRKPYEQIATIKAARQWKSWVKDYCTKIVNGKYTQLRGKANNGNQDEADARMIMEDRLNNGAVLSQCQSYLQRNGKIETDAKFSYFVDEIPSGLKYYAKDLNSAMASGIGLKTRFSDISGSLYKTLRTVKAKIHTMISIHEILVNNENSKIWRNEFQQLNDKYDQIRLNKIENIAKKFKKPFDLYKGNNGDELRKKIASLYQPQEHKAEIILNDNSIRHYKEMLNNKEGAQYDAIAFYAIVEDDGKRDMHYGWYQKNSKTSEETINIQTSESFGKIERKSKDKVDKKNIKKKRVEENLQKKTNIDAQIDQINNQRDQLLDKTNGQMNGRKTKKSSSTNNSTRFSLTSLITSLLMILAGIFITRKTTLGLLPVKTAQIMSNLLDKTAPILSVIGFILLGLGLYGLVISLLHFNIMSLFISLVSVLSGFLLSIYKILNFDVSTFKGNEQTAKKIKHTITRYESKLNLVKSQSLPIGIAAIITGIYQLLF